MNAKRLGAAGVTAIGAGCVVAAFLWRGDAEPTVLDLVEAFRADPVGTVERVAAMKDPIHQRAHIVALSEAHPGQVGPLCEHLDDDAVRAYCLRLAERAHLRNPLSEPGTRVSPQRSVPASIWVHGVLPASLSSTWEGLLPDPAG